MAFQLQATNLDPMDMQGRRQILLDLAKLDEPTLSFIGVEPENGPIFVLDMPELVYAGSELEALRAYALTNSLEIGEPTRVPEEYSEGLEIWEVRMSAYGSDAGAIATAASKDQAQEALLVALRELSGGQVVGIKEWAANQGAEDILAELERTLLQGPKKAPKPKLPQFLVARWQALAPLPVAKAATECIDTAPQKVRRKQAYETLALPSGVSPLGPVEVPQSNWAIRVFEEGGRVYANHHDIIAALHMGLDPHGIDPWPNDVAHRFLVAEELRRAMRARGFAQLQDFDPSKWVHLRVSKLEFTPEITGDAAQTDDKPFDSDQEKPQWPPELGKELRVVIVLDRARLAYETEAEWERVALRTPIQRADKLWVEREGPYERPSKAKAAKPRKSVAKAKECALP